jgi:hypothetical protein
MTEVDSRLLGGREIFSRYRPRLTFEQYKILKERQREARRNRKQIKYRDLYEAWGIRQSTLGNAVSRGIKQYDERLARDQAGTS